MAVKAATEQAITALSAVAAIWEARLAGDWHPPDTTSFPWAQVRLSLAALLPGMRAGGAWSSPSPPAPLPQGRERGEPTVTLILAGNTPLLSWSPLCACLLAGVRRIRVKMSRDETVWTPLFVETVATVDAGLAARIELYDFPGEDERMDALLRDADAVIAYGTDASITALKARTPPDVPFFGYGHAVSVGIVMDEESAREQAYEFASDIFLYDQQGCLSPHILYVRFGVPMTTVREGLMAAFTQSEPVVSVGTKGNIAIASAVRQARDLALFAGHRVYGGESLQWTIIEAESPIPYPVPVGHGVIYMSPMENAEQLAEMLAPVRGIVSCAGVAGHLIPEWEAVLTDVGVSRICKAGEMQTPPLDWPNGNRDLLSELQTILTRS